MNEKQTNNICVLLLEALMILNSFNKAIIEERIAIIEIIRARGLSNSKAIKNKTENRSIDSTEIRSNRFNVFHREFASLFSFSGRFSF